MCAVAEAASGGFVHK